MERTTTRRPNNTTLLAIFATILILSPFRSNAQPSTIPAKRVALYIFGDSLYDTGMALYVNKGPAADAYPYGETYFKKPAGRFSDGRLIPDYIAQFANLPLPEPYLNPNLKDFTQSVNFADAAAGVLVETRPNTLNLKLQTEYFVEMVQKLAKQYGQTEANKLIKRSVLLFNIGANDYVDLYNFNSHPLSSTLIDFYMNEVLGNFTTHLTTMYNQGARKFAFQSAAPLGCLPAFLQSDGSCNKELNDLALTHNAGFKQMLKKITRQCPGFKYSLYNFYPSLYARINSPDKYGFKEVQSACCGSGPFNGKFTCMEKSNFTLCDDPTDHLWFDAGHPTQRADFQFAREFWSGSTNVVTPRNLQTFFDN